MRVAHDFQSKEENLLQMWARMLCTTGCEALQTLPHSLCSLTALTRLDLAGCTSLAWLPGGVQHLQALRELVLTRCSALSDLPAGVGSLPRLRVLDVGECAINNFVLS